MVDTLAAAKAALDETIDLILIGARFDDSRMFDLLDHIRHDARLKMIPVVAAIISPTAMSAETIAGLEHTTKILGASLFINLNDFPDHDTENMRLRIVLEAILLPPDAVPIVAEKLRPPE